MQKFLSETTFLNFRHPVFDTIEFNFGNNPTQQKLAVTLYYFIRDKFLYDPFHLSLTYDALTASNILNKKRAWCVEKSIVLAALSRRFGIPSRLGFAIVKNHLGENKLSVYLKREEIVFHGYVSLNINGNWVKCTPAFDKRVCAINGVSPLEWDGKTDSLFQEFQNDNKFMEYIHFYGEFDDVPIELMNAEMKKYYPHLFQNRIQTKEFSFEHLPFR
jgi:hypothetical protein